MLQQLCAGLPLALDRCCSMYTLLSADVLEKRLLQPSVVALRIEEARFPSVYMSHELSFTRAGRKAER